MIKLILSVLFLVCPTLHCQTGFDEEFLKPLQYRNLGPYRAGCWIGDIAVPESEDLKYRYTFYVAPRNGGVWKTVNNGVTFKPIFDDYGTNAIGSIAVAPSNPEILWVGTGEDFNCRLSYYGNGIYKSLDGGKSFKNMGLKDSHHISRIRIHPQNPDIVYVAVMGHLFSFNEERGVFKTGDGGETWEKVLYINEKVGVIDLVMNLDNPEILYACAYDKDRSPWHLERGGKESGIYKTVDGGKNWTRLEGGLPRDNVGRIGLDIYRKDPRILYAVVENCNKKSSEKEEIFGGEVYRTEDSGANWKKMNGDQANVSGKAAYSFNKIIVDPNNDQNVYVGSITLTHSHDRGRTWQDLEWPAKHLFTRMFGDVRSFWMDPKDSNHLMVGSDGGLFISYDGGKNMDHLYNIPLGEIYCVGLDMEDPYNIYVGLQDHDGWKAPINTWHGEITLDDWRLVGLWDGMYHSVDPQNSRWLYITTQFGGHHRVDQLKGERVSIKPKNKDYRYPWTPVMIISPHDSKRIYAGAQMVLVSNNRGDDWEEISKDLTHNDPEKIAGEGNMMYCTITSISESSIKPGVIWVGTDDGRVHLTRNSGKNWEEMTDRIKAPKDAWVTRVLASPHDAAWAYVVKSGFKSDDFTPYLFMTKDFGETWEAINSNLPEAPLNVVIQDRKNPNLLFVGNTLGVYVTMDGGKRWVPFKNNMPPVPVQDLKIHPRENDLVVGTYGRGAYVTDISCLQELTPEVLEKEFYLFDMEPKPQINHSKARHWGNYRLDGNRHLFTPNESNGIVIYYTLKKESGVKLLVRDANGEEVKSIKGTSHVGLNRVIWRTSVKTKPGVYLVELNVDGEKITKPAQVRERIYFPLGKVTPKEAP